MLRTPYSYVLIPKWNVVECFSTPAIQSAGVCTFLADQIGDRRALVEEALTAIEGFKSRARPGCHEDCQAHCLH